MTHNNISIDTRHNKTQLLGWKDQPALIQIVTPRFPNIKIYQTNNQSNHDLNGMLHFSKILNGIIN